MRQKLAWGKCFTYRYCTRSVIEVWRPPIDIPMSSASTFSRSSNRLLFKVALRGPRPLSKVLKMSVTTAATPSKPKHEWLVILPDHEGVLEKRMSVRPYAHLPYLPYYLLQATEGNLSWSVKRLTIYFEARISRVWDLMSKKDCG